MKMPSALYDEFARSQDTLRIYVDGELRFRSDRPRLEPLLEYLGRYGARRGLEVYDRITGNAAALLSIKAGASMVLSPVGSELAAATLRQHGVDFYFESLVPFIATAEGSMCPMERLSLGKTPEAFHAALIRRREVNGERPSSESV